MNNPVSASTPSSLRGSPDTPTSLFSISSSSDEGVLPNPSPKVIQLNIDSYNEHSDDEHLDDDKVKLIVQVHTYLYFNLHLQLIT